MIISMFLDVLMFIMSIKNHRQVGCILSVTKLLICFNQSCNFCILNLESEVIDFIIIQYCDGILKTCCDAISQVNAGVAEVLMQCRLV